MSINKVILIGNVGSDPDIRYPEKDFVVARLSLATNERRGESNAEVTEWHTLMLTGSNARIAERYVRKGSKLYVEGHLRYREYEDKFKIQRRVAVIDVTVMELLGRQSTQN
ncbi:MAG: single-stranded DNA-binding protein [Muribaculaceae bacterium]|nr:single-stranded DNA-binding protein [Muribaculaceae bacterium]MDE6295400.1 single-stranded DNA-binding protein [Muribaculaceae bacterium]